MSYTPGSNITVTDWADGGAITFTTVTGGAGNPVKGATTEDAVYWKRIDDTLFAKYYYYQTGAGTDGDATALLVTLPNSLSFDTSKFGTIPAADATLAAADSCIGRGRITITYGGTTYNYEVTCYPYSSTKFWMIGNHTTTGGSFTSALGTANFFDANPFILYLEITCPINGW